MPTLIETLENLFTQNYGRLFTSKELRVIVQEKVKYEIDYDDFSHVLRAFMDESNLPICMFKQHGKWRYVNSTNKYYHFKHNWHLKTKINRCIKRQLA